MPTTRISLACTTFAFAALGLAAACSSSNNKSGPSNSSSATNTSSNTGTSSGGTSSSSGSNTANDSGSSAGGTLIDDMSNPSGQIKLAVTSSSETAGYWFTTINDTGGTITPVPATNGGAWSYTAITNPPAGATIANAACINGATSPTQYSEAGMGFNFALQKIDAGADSGVSAPAVEYDISSHKGISFWVFGAADAGTQSVRVLFPDHTTDPRGGVCPPAATDTTQCYDSWQDPIPVAPGWSQQTIHYTPVMPGTSGDLTQQGFGLSEATGFDDAHVYGMTFQIDGPKTGDAGAGTPFDFCVADIQFVDQ